LVFFVSTGNTELVKAILAEDASQRDACTSQDGATPLMFAAMLGHLDIVQLLVGYGCDINKQDTISGWTALMQATFHGLVIS
jgi:ankyrin repeat protein